MAQFTLSPDEWTQIVPADGTVDVRIHPLFGSFQTSLNTPSEVGAATLVMPPVPPKAQLLSERDVTAGAAVYAKAIREPAIVNVAPVAK